MQTTVGGIRNATPPTPSDKELVPLQVGPNGELLVGQTAGGAAVSSTNALPVASVPRVVDVAFTTLTRPANTTAYTALDSISDNPTAGSVTALPAMVSDLNDAPLVLTHLKLETTDTGFGGQTIRAYVYNSDPTASSGVGGGDNAAFSNKKAGLIGTFTGTLHAMSDGASGNLAPEDAPHYECLPESGGKRLWVQYQAMTAATPSANSTTFIGKVKGFQGRA